MQAVQAVTLMFEDMMGNIVAIKMLSHHTMARAMRAYYDRHAIQPNTLLFRIQRTGAYITPQDTPAGLGLVEMDVVRVSRGTDEV